MGRKVEDTDVKGKKKGGKLHWKNSLFLQKIDRVRSGEKYFKTFFQVFIVFQVIKLRRL